MLPPSLQQVKDDINASTKRTSASHQLHMPGRLTTVDDIGHFLQLAALKETRVSPKNVSLKRRLAHCLEIATDSQPMIAVARRASKITESGKELVRENGRIFKIDHNTWAPMMYQK